ncbi:TetR/AcrR family transcriptional regulator [Actinomadura chibensis]|uniref:TetR/AcrR family transcriptional regulator n=3 Tax=Thermomonosporaceae TaxID=2012 RepID=A0A5D0NHJ4_9ACTN|nr:TetR/AcrR family transcriptional regulator [Actinomadura chibensis]TYK48503.1 TetR/AcrR family transcriptional regulator [Actinomadura decatromicini]
MRADARRNYERLITTARTAFMEHGTGASLDDIAKRAGVGSGTLYRHFPTRDALLHAVLRDRIDALLAHADELLAEPAPDPEAEALDAEAALGRWLRTYLTGAATPRGTATVIIEAMSAEWAHTGLGAAAAAICDALGRLLDRAQRAGAIRPEVGPRDLLRITNAIGVAAERTSDPSAYSDRMLALLFDGLRTG